MRRGLLIRVVGASCFILGHVALMGGTTAAAPDAPASTTRWAPARQIASKIYSWFPDAALDSAGNLHVVWNASETNTPTYAQEEAITEPTIRDYLMYQGFGTADTPIAPATDIGLAHGG